MSELYVSVSPHIRSPRTTQTIMRDVLIALCPALIASCIIFGARALLVSAVCVAASVLFEFLYQKGTKQPVTISDCLTGSDQIGHMAFQTVDFRHFRSPPVIIYPSSLAFQP